MWMYLRFWFQKHRTLCKNGNFNLDLEHFYYFFSIIFNLTVYYTCMSTNVESNTLFW